MFPKEKIIYLMHLLNGIEEADLIFLIGTNPRYEATILNARIRKSYLNNNTKILSLNDNGDLTYPYESLDGNTQTLKNIFEGTNDLSKIILDSKKPMIILGESFLRLNSAEFLYEKILEFLKHNKKFSEDWNPINILSCDAAISWKF